MSNVSIAARNNNSNKNSTQLSGFDFGGKAKPRKLQKGLYVWQRKDVESEIRVLQSKALTNTSCS